MRPIILLLFALILTMPFHSTWAGPQATVTAAQDQPFVVEYYYKVKWGHAEEFITLFKKNHYPLLLKEIALGRLLKVSAVSPRYHTTEDGRWGYRVTIVFKNAATANDGFDEKPSAQANLLRSGDL